MEPKMLEFPNPYCQDWDQGDLDDLIFAVGGLAGPSERWRLDRKNGACYIELEKLYFSWYWQYWMQISLVFSKMGTNQNLLRQYIMRWLHFDSNSSLESKWSFFVARIWISCLKPCYSLSQCVCCSVYIYIYLYVFIFIVVWMEVCPSSFCSTYGAAPASIILAANVCRNICIVTWRIPAFLHTRFRCAP